MQRLLLLGVLCTVGCGLDWSIPIDAKAVCTSDEECPRGTRCSTNLGLCQNKPNARPELLWDIQPTTPLSGTDAFTVTLTVSVDPGIAPEVVLNVETPVALTLESVSGRTFIYSGNLTGAEIAGSYELLGTLGGILLGSYGPIVID